MAEQRDTHSIGFDELADPVALGLDDLDRERAASLGELADAREARATVMERERSRLSLKLGPEHPRVLAIAAELEINAPLVRDLRLEAESAAVPDPVPDPDTWLVHGHVRDAQGQGLAGLTVAPFTGDGQWLQALGHACTDQSGYFRLATTHATGEPVQLHVLSPAGDNLYADELSLPTTPGTSVYRLLILDGGTGPCVPPNWPDSATVPLPEGWVVRGRVTDADGKGIPGLIVTVYDRDLLFDDRLGQAETGADGSYLLGYRTEDFRDLIERKPDLYLDVRSRDGEVLHRCRRPIRYQAGRVEIVDVRLSGKTGRSQ